MAIEALLISSSIPLQASYVYIVAWRLKCRIAGFAKWHTLLFNTWGVISNLPLY